MASPLNYSISSFIMSNIDNEDQLNDEFEDESNSIYHEDNSSEITFTTDMDTSVIDSDYEDHEHVLSGGDSLIHSSSSYDNLSSNSIQLDSDQEFEEEQIEHKTKNIKPDNAPEESDTSDAVDPSQKCPICLGAWTSAGDHRLCALRCGHLFGFKCIKQWLKSNNECAKKCPQCNAKASMKHIRFIYAYTLTEVDTAEIERMKKQMEKVQLREVKIRKALKKQKQRTKKYKKMYKARTLALAMDSDICFSD